MARIRSVHPEICIDEALATVSAKAERTFVRLWPHLDDEGRAIDNPKLLKAALYPLHDAITAEDIDRDLSELASAQPAPLLIRYQVGGRNYLSTKPAAWSRWQKPRHRYESKLPAPDDPSAEPRPTTVGPQSNPPPAEERTDTKPHGHDTSSDVRRPAVGAPSDDRRPVVGGEEGEESRRESEEGEQPHVSRANSRPPDPAEAAADPRFRLTDDQRQQRLAEAVELLVDREIERHPTTGPSVKRHRDGIRRGKLHDHHDQGHRYLGLNPNLTAVALADLLEPRPAQRPTDPHAHPLDGQQKATMARAETGTAYVRAVNAEPRDDAQGLAHVADIRDHLHHPGAAP